MTKINLHAHYVKGEFESIGLDGTGGKVQVSGPNGKTKWINASHAQLEQIASILGNDAGQPPSTLGKFAVRSETIAALIKAISTQQYWKENDNLTAALRDWDTQLSQSPTSRITHSTWELYKTDIDMDSPEADDRVMIRYTVTYVVMDFNAGVPVTESATSETIYVRITLTSFCNDGTDGWQ